MGSKDLGVTDGSGLQDKDSGILLLLMAQAGVEARFITKPTAFVAKIHLQFSPIRI